MSGWRPLKVFRYEEEYISTNGDRMRQMSDEELAKTLSEVETGVRTYSPDIYSHWIEWVKSPADLPEKEEK